MGGFVWVTLATNDSYSLGALVLAHSLRKVGTAHKLAVLITPAVSPAMREQLGSVYDVVKVVDVLDSKDETNLALLKRPELGITFTKLHCWQLTEFEKGVFLDADTLVVRNCDELFDRDEFSAAPDVGWPDCFNSGVFVFRPSVETFNNLIQFAVEKGSFDGGDQGLLNQFFSTWATDDIKKHLPFVYNLTSVAVYSYKPAFKQYGAETRIVHFIGPVKPWLQPVDPSSKTVTPTPDSEHLQSLLQQWWDLFIEKVHPGLSTSLDCDIGMLPFFAQLTCSTDPLDSTLARSDPPPQSLEPSFPEPYTPYIEKDDERQYNLPYQPFQVVSVEGELLNITFSDFARDSDLKESEFIECDYVEPVIDNVEPEVEEEKEILDEVEPVVEEPRYENTYVDDNQFNYHNFVPDETCIQAYLEHNVQEYQPREQDNSWCEPHPPPESTQWEPPALPRFLTIPQDDQRQSNQAYVREPSPENYWSHEEQKEWVPWELPVEQHIEPTYEPIPVRAPSPVHQPNEPDHTISRSKSMSNLMIDATNPASLNTLTAWKSQPDVGIETPKKLPGLKPLLPKEKTPIKLKNKPKYTESTEVHMINTWSDPLGPPADTVGFVERAIMKRTQSQNALFNVPQGALEPNIPVTISNPILPIFVPQEMNEYVDLLECKRQSGNKPMPQELKPGKEERLPRRRGKRSVRRAADKWKPPETIEATYDVDLVMKRLSEFSGGYTPSKLPQEYEMPLHDFTKYRDYVAGRAEISNRGLAAFDDIVSNGNVESAADRLFRDSSDPLEEKFKNTINKNVLSHSSRFIPVTKKEKKKKLKRKSEKNGVTDLKPFAALPGESLSEMDGSVPEIVVCVASPEEEVEFGNKTSTPIKSLDETYIIDNDTNSFKSPCSEKVNSEVSLFESLTNISDMKNCDGSLMMNGSVASDETFASAKSSLSPDGENRKINSLELDNIIINQLDQLNEIEVDSSIVQEFLKLQINEEISISKPMLSAIVEESVELEIENQTSPISVEKSVPIKDTSEEKITTDITQNSILPVTLEKQIEIPLPTLQTKENVLKSIPICGTIAENNSGLEENDIVENTKRFSTSSEIDKKIDESSVNIVPISNQLAGLSLNPDNTNEFKATEKLIENSVEIEHFSNSVDESTNFKVVKTFASDKSLEGVEIAEDSLKFDFANLVNDAEFSKLETSSPSKIVQPPFKLPENVATPPALSYAAAAKKESNEVPILEESHFSPSKPKPTKLPPQQNGVKPKRSIKSKVKPVASTSQQSTVVQPTKVIKRKAEKMEVEYPSNRFELLPKEIEEGGINHKKKVKKITKRFANPSTSNSLPPPLTESIVEEDTQLYLGEPDDNPGIAGAIAQLNLDSNQSGPSSECSAAQAEYLRRQSWETGKMDYMGRDSFANVLSKINETISQQSLTEDFTLSSNLPHADYQPVSLSMILDCESIETLPADIMTLPVEAADDDIIFNRQPDSNVGLPGIKEEAEEIDEEQISSDKVIIIQTVDENIAEENIKVSSEPNQEIRIFTTPPTPLEETDSSTKALLNEHFLPEVKETFTSSAVLKLDEQSDLKQSSEVGESLEMADDASALKVSKDLANTSSSDKLEGLEADVSLSSIDLKSSPTDVESSLIKTSSAVLSENLTEGKITSNENNDLKSFPTEVEKEEMAKNVPEETENLTQEVNTLRDDSLVNAVSKSSETRAISLSPATTSNELLIDSSTAITPNKSENESLLRCTDDEKDDLILSKKSPIALETSDITDQQHKKDVKHIKTPSNSPNLDSEENATANIDYSQSDISRESPLPLIGTESTSAFAAYKPQASKEKNIVEPIPIKRQTSTEEGKEKKGMFTKILEFVGVVKKKEEPETATSVFYDDVFDNKPEEISTGAVDGIQSILKATDLGAIEDVAEGPKKRSPSPRINIPKVPNTHVTAATPPTAPAQKPSRRDPDALSVDLTILETPPVVEKKTSILEEIELVLDREEISTEIDNIIEKAKLIAEDQLDTNDPLYTDVMKEASRMGINESPKPPLAICEDFEELKVTSNEDRKRPKDNVSSSSKLAGQILKAIPPPRRRPISDARSSPESRTTEEKEIPENVSESTPQPPPVPPRRNRSRSRNEPQAPPKRKPKK